MSNSKFNSFLVTKSSILLIIAHPDDEVMFFSPFLTLLTSRSILGILCLSSGNANGLGEIRKKELRKAANIYNIEAKNIHIVDHAKLQDGMSNDWPVEVVSEVIVDFVHKLKPDLIVSFDECGVSSHPNHISTYLGLVKAFARLKEGGTNLVALKLKSKNFFRKFCGPIDLLFSYLFAENFVWSLWSVFNGLKGIYVHQSQNVWYRRLFVLMSSFSYVNSFTELNAKSY